MCVSLCDLGLGFLKMVCTRAQNGHLQEIVSLQARVKGSRTDQNFCFLVPLCQYIGERTIIGVELAIKELPYSKETPKVACVLWLQSHLTFVLQSSICDLFCH